MKTFFSTGSRKVLELGYNCLNLLRDVKIASGVLKSRYCYLAEGTKLEIRDKEYKMFKISCSQTLFRILWEIGI